MKFGIFYEMQLPKPWGPTSELDIFQQSLEQVELADQLGYDYVWEVEHHFLEEYSHSSAPEIFLAAASQRTRNIRLGHGIVLMPPAYNHPARTAERIATLDLISNGRVDFGTGESSSEMELGGFGVSREEKREQWEESLRCLVGMFRDEPWEFHGKYIDFPKRNVIPKPLQKPHPPLWVACSNPDTVYMAAKYGLGTLGFDFSVPGETAKRRAEYYRIIREECEPIGDAVNAQYAVVSGFMCCPRDEEAVEKGVPGMQFFGYALSHYYSGTKHEPGNTDLMNAFAGATSVTGNAETGGCIGSPKTIRNRLLALEEAGVDQVIFVAQAGATKHDDIMSSLRLFASELLPEFKERDIAHQKRRAEWLGESSPAEPVAAG
ncbi:MAG: LLM class flavin-dependent oxidoreductase [Chloroflexi bacterium]|nr:LLM class flavin-dependent oxidoreductase [Chloroflexota bacterium]